MIDRFMIIKFLGRYSNLVMKILYYLEVDCYSLLFFFILMRIKIIDNLVDSNIVIG